MADTKVSAPAPTADHLRMESGELAPVSPLPTGPASNEIAVAQPPTYNQTREAYGTPNEKSNPLNAPQVQPARMVTPLTALGREEATVDCPRCCAAVKTRIERHAGQQAQLWSVLICLCVGCLCAWIPCVIDDCKDTEHYCGTCNMQLATVKASGSVALSDSVRKVAGVGSQYNAGPTIEAGPPRKNGAPGPTMQSQFPSTTGQQYQRGEQMQESGHVAANGQVAELK
ncbi:hypothetical protein K461DRAFT_297174 [Myriangium duriaei CBS 260.36]|uniref:LITAF domain-containing protein n=1 Tax=Myriangium duriaei CBS 260.36 TaxID=1168546 RepID=A0A9P4ITY0_9PEZI|nr:hypothetical protein K461DRAFT_297174 [Myriangium duriaei CBS 260.36]